MLIKIKQFINIFKMNKECTLFETKTQNKHKEYIFNFKVINY